MSTVNPPDQSSSPEIPQKKESSTQIIEVLQNFAEKLRDNRSFSGILAIQIGNKTIVHQAYCPVGAKFEKDQIFNCFSVGKLFTAVGIMQLVEQGLLKLEEPISKYLSKEELDLSSKPPYKELKPSKEDLEKLKDSIEKITIRKLLTHRSGLIQIKNEPREKFFEEIPPDIKKPYSNYGYQLLARIIGKNTKSSQANASNWSQRFLDHLQNEVFFKSDMNIAPSSTHVPQGYEFKDGRHEPVDSSPEPYPHGNGCWKMQTKDLLAFGKALRENAHIRSDTFNSMLNEGLCFWIDRDSSNNIIGYGHPGGVRGGSAFFQTFMAKGQEPITAVVLSNSSTGTNIKLELEGILKENRFW
ncbi:MAG: hypothetical protein K1000chlam3_00390 [Chlamydiae bacterium]|nr:hypothetical protein [Chlamydiota bacterium]